MANQAAALKIQSWWRMIQARKTFHQKNDAALKIQSWWRMVTARRAFAKQQEAALQTQTRRLLTLLEPLLILSLGLVIALIIIAILLGILSVNELVA